MPNLGIALFLAVALACGGILWIRGAILMLLRGHYTHPAGLEFRGALLRAYAAFLVALACGAFGLAVLLVRRAMSE